MADYKDPRISFESPIEQSFIEAVLTAIFKVYLRSQDKYNGTGRPYSKEKAQHRFARRSGARNLLEFGGNHP